MQPNQKMRFAPAQQRSDQQPQGLDLSALYKQRLAG